MILPEADAVDRLLLDEAASWLAQASCVTVIEDLSGALAMRVAELYPQVQVRVCCDSLVDEHRVRNLLAGLELDDRVEVTDDLRAAAAEADVALIRLPKSLAALEEVAGVIAAVAGQVRVFAGGRVKHMTRSMNEVLGRHFTTVEAGWAGRNRGCCALLHRWPSSRAGGPLPSTMMILI